MATTKKRPVTTKAKPAARTTPAMRQRALELAVSVSGINYTSAYSAGMSQYRPSERRRSYEDASTIIATARTFLDFMAKA